MCIDKGHTRCTSCMHLRETLRKALSRSQDDSLNISRTSADSHTNYGKLTSAEKEARMKNLHEAVSSLKSKIRSLERKVAQLIDKMVSTLRMKMQKMSHS